jgi:hypothetical protein
MMLAGIAARVANAGIERRMRHTDALSGRGSGVAIQGIRFNVAEPGSLGLLMMGLLATLALVRRRRST